MRKLPLMPTWSSKGEGACPLPKESGGLACAELRQANMSLRDAACICCASEAKRSLEEACGRGDDDGYRGLAIALMMMRIEENQRVQSGESHGASGRARGDDQDGPRLRRWRRRCC